MGFLHFSPKNSWSKHEDLDMPFEDIEQLDIGWSWGAIDFLPAMMLGS